MKLQRIVISFCFLDFEARSGRRLKSWKDRWTGENTLEATFPDIYGISMKQKVTTADCWNE